MQHKDVVTWALISFGVIVAGVLASHVAERIVYPIVDPILDKFLQVQPTTQAMSIESI